MAKKKQKTTSKFSEAESVLKVGDLVGAKVKGYPIWPGRIESIDYINNKRRCTVRFFGTNDSSQSLIEILPYRECSFKPTGSKSYKEALQLSQSEYNSMQTISHELTTKIIRVDNPSMQTISHELATKDIKEEEPSMQTIAHELTTKDIKEEEPLASENVMISKAVMQTTLAKLKEKLDKKIEEREKRKKELLEGRLHKKISNKLKVFNKQLARFSTILSKISMAKSAGRDDVGTWKEAVQTFHSVLPALNKCIEKVMLGTGLKASNLTQCRECQETLRKIRLNIKTSEKNNLVPTDIKEELIGCMGKIESNAEIQKFIEKDFENLKNDMIQRKENNA